MRYLLVMRVGLALAVLAMGFVVPQSPGLVYELVLSTSAYGVLQGLGELRRGRGQTPRLGLIGWALVLDGFYLAWAAYLTGGVQSPIRVLVYAHLIAVTLLASYRTGLKIALWHSLLFFVVVYAQAGGLLPNREALPSLLPGAGRDFDRVALANVLAFWIVALATATFSSVNERVLRRRRADLEGLAAMVAEIDRRNEAAEIPGILLDKLVQSFSFRRGVVLASPEGDLLITAYRGSGEPESLEPGMDPVMERALSGQSTQLLRRLDAAVDRRLASLLPEARNVIVVPLTVDRGYRLGVLALEHGGRSGRIERWTVSVVERFASHAALALRNAWLLDDNVRKLEENRHLRDELLAQNVDLEARVVERTREVTESLEELRKAHGERQRLLSHLVRAQEDERRRVAGGIHDDSLQKLISLNMRLQMLQKHIPEPDLAVSVDQLREIVKQTIAGLRSLMFELRPPILEEEGLAAALSEYVEQWDMQDDVTIEDALVEQPIADQRVILYRIAMEALSNIRKHANATRVEVHLESRESGILLRVVDDGVGFGAPDGMRSQPGHLGLTSMSERAELAGGWCRILTLPQHGTTVEAWLPGGSERWGDTVVSGARIEPVHAV